METQEICGALNRLEALDYRLPTFDEWMHACGVAGALAALRDLGSEPEMAGLPRRFHLAAAGPRNRVAAYIDANGVIDPLGNLLTWISDESLSDSVVKRLIRSSPLAARAEGAEAPENSFSFAAGNHWQDDRITPGRLEQLVWRSPRNPDWQDKVGVRLLRDRSTSIASAGRYRLILSSELREGYEFDNVVRAVSKSTLTAASKVRSLFEVAPVEILSSMDYEYVSHQRRCWSRSGARVSID